MGLIFFFLPPPVSSGQYREVHPFGPSPTGFNTDLVLELDPSVLSTNRVLATMDGMVAVIPDPAPATTCTLVLRPASKKTDIEVMKGHTVHVYRNIDTASVGTAISPIIAEMAEKKFLDVLTQAQRVTKFLQGYFGVFVDSGSVLGQLSTSNGVGGWGRVGFEIVVIPGGLRSPGGSTFSAQDGWKRLKELIAPGSMTRRFEPMAFYKYVDSKGILDISHVGHPMFTMLTRRAMLEVRDEYDAPVVGGVDVYDGRDGTTTHKPLTADMRGTIVLDSLPFGSSGTPTTATYGVSLPGYVFTENPAGEAALAAPTATMTAPAFVGVQRIFMADADDPDNWFVKNTGLPRFTAGNKVTPIRDGVSTFEQYTSAVRSLTLPAHTMYLAAYDLYDDFRLVPGDAASSFHDLTTAVANRGANIYALAWDRYGTQNSNEVDRLNALPGGHGHAILDNDTLSGGAHHQKLLLVNGNRGAFAFCGGIDIRPNRLDSPNHGAPAAFHDVHARIDGPAVANMHHTFVERWNSQSSPPGGNLSTSPPSVSADGSAYVQVARTYAPAKKYPFAPSGSLTCLQAIIKAINKAKKFIYIEDQFLFPYPDEGGADSVGVLDALVDALSRIDYLIMVTSTHVAVNGAHSHRRDFIQKLYAAAPSKVFVFGMDRSLVKPRVPRSNELAEVGWCEFVWTAVVVDSCSGDQSYESEIYCHSKVWIIDDVICKIGSANCNRRSYTNDSEMDLVVIDGALGVGGRKTAQDLRMELWAEHLGLTSRVGELQDYKHALYFWQHFAGNTHIAVYNSAESDPPAWRVPLLPWSNADPDGR
jgi:phosphatidylserine/phosphatidylglycerophosphate/cardiolipin synthase-like enzyme